MAPTPFQRHVAETRARLDAAGVARPGPGSVSWTINREIVVVAGWGRAVLLQIAHPLVAAGVDDHSRFRAGPRTRLARLRSTVSAMLSLTFGDDDAAVAAAARINEIHDRVFGRIRASAGTFAAGTGYSAHDADLLRWVHATLVDSILRTYDALVRPLTQDERDRYCAEAAVMEPLLDIPSGTLPRTATALDAFMRDAFLSGRIAVTDRGRALARAVLFPPGWRLFWPAFRPAQLITTGLLPADVRQAYGFAWTPRDARALARWTRALRTARNVMPGIVTQWPSARRRSDLGPRSAESRKTLTPA